jgi:multicomponent Na+:H+ antiporter subunit F
MMLIVVAIAVLATMVFAMARALLGPTVYDRILALNMFGTKTVIFLSLVAALYQRPDFIDLALGYALINFIGVLAVLEFFQSRAQRLAATERRGRP